MQNKLNFDFVKKCPFNSYARKNIGYLVSFNNDSEIIIETDDDNYPKKNFFKYLRLEHNVKETEGKDWVNVYSKFIKTKNSIWPRGLPLDKIEKRVSFKKKRVKKKFFVKQGVCEGNPDVDAIYRIINKNIDIKFRNNFKFSLGKAFSPLNSQNTIWSKEVFPLLYLPVTCSMRATDIWRGIIALNIIQKNNLSVLFFGTTMFQNRNMHNLAKDLKDEMPLYKDVNKAYEILKNLNLKKDKKNYLKNLLKSYQSLIKNNIFDKKELLFLNSWIKDLNIILNKKY